MLISRDIYCDIRQVVPIDKDIGRGILWLNTTRNSQPRIRPPAYLCSANVFDMAPDDLASWCLHLTTGPLGADGSWSLDHVVPTALLPSPNICYIWDVGCSPI